MKKQKVEQVIIERLKREPEDFAWCPSLSNDPLNRDQLIKEIDEKTELGQLYIRMIVEATISRMKR